MLRLPSQPHHPISGERRAGKKFLNGHLCKPEGGGCSGGLPSPHRTIYLISSINCIFIVCDFSGSVSPTQHRTRHSLPARITRSFDHQRFRRKPAMTSSRTILIETNRLFRDGLKHLLNGTRFEVGAEFNTVDLARAAETAETPDLVISGQ